MKLFIYKIFLLFFVFNMTTCSSQKLDPETYQRQWMLVSFKKYTRDFLVKNKAYLDISPTKSAPNQYRAYMGCNNISIKGEFKKDGTVKFGDFMSTYMYCEDNQGLEKTFIYELSKMSKFKIDGHQLTLSDGKGNEMKFVAADWD